jgi:hypothetical protein
MRGESACVAEGEGVQVTVENRVAGEMNLSGAGTLSQEALSTLLQQVVTTQLVDSATPAPTDTTTNSSTANSTSNTINASTLGDARRLQMSSGQCFNQTNNQTSPAVSIPFSVPTQGASSESIDSVEILKQLESRLAEDHPELSICASWVVLPIVVSEVVIKKETGAEIDVDDYVARPSSPTSKASAQYELEKVLVLALIIAASLLFVGTVAYLIYISKRSGFYINHWGGITYFGHPPSEDREADVEAGACRKSIPEKVDDGQEKDVKESERKDVISEIVIDFKEEDVISEGELTQTTEDVTQLEYTSSNDDCTIRRDGMIWSL